LSALRGDRPEPAHADYAASRQAADKRIEWRQADALDLPFEDAAFDVVCCQFGVMFFPNRVAGYAEARRVLQPADALSSASGTASRRTRLPTRSPCCRTVFPRDPPLFLAPHTAWLSRRRTDPRELSRARFHDIKISTRAEVSRAPSGTPRCYRILPRNAAAKRNREARDASLLQLATERATVAIASRHGEGPVAGKIQAHVIVAAAS